MPLKRAARINAHTLREDTDPEWDFHYVDISSVDSAGRIRIGERMRFESSPSRARRLVREGDTILSTVRTYLRAIAAIDARLDGAVASTGFATLTPRDDIDPRFLWRACQTSGFVEAVQANSVGVSFPAIAPQDLGALEIPVPPLATQRRIADVLDRETARMDELIEMKERLLALLEEKRTALITQAVTKGLDPDVRLKDSGVEWLGEVPAHWEVGPLRRFATVVDCKHRTPQYVPDGLPLISTSEVSSGELRLDRCTRFVTEDDFADMTEGQRLPCRGDIIYSRNASLGSAAYVDTDKPFCMGQDIVLIRPVGIGGALLSLLLNSRAVQSQVEAIGVGSTFSRINVSAIRSLIVSWPPFDEQRRLVRVLTERVSSIQAIRGRVLRAIALLREYRTALITGAVTGEVDVGDRTV